MRFILLIPLLLATGCASIVSDSDYPVTFNAKEGQSYTVKNELGQEVFVGKGTQMQMLKAGGSFNCMDYNVITDCGHSPVPSSIDGWVFGNILFGGIIGVVVDPMTGAACKLPSYVSVPSCRSRSTQVETEEESEDSDS